MSKLKYGETIWISPQYSIFIDGQQNQQNQSSSRFWIRLYKAETSGTIINDYSKVDKNHIPPQFQYSKTRNDFYYVPITIYEDKYTKEKSYMISPGYINFTSKNTEDANNKIQKIIQDVMAAGRREYSKTNDLLTGEYFCILGQLSEEEQKKIKENLLETNPYITFEKCKSDKIKTKEDIDKYFSQIIFNENTLKKIKEATEVYSLIGETPKNTGCILYGPPGTGKSELISILKEIYTDAGAYICDKVIGHIGAYQGERSGRPKTWYVGGRFLDYEKDEKGCYPEAKKRHLPSLLIIDEAIPFLDKNNDKFEDTRETIKTYSGKKINEIGTVTIIAANIEFNDIDNALKRDLRLEPIEIPLPTEKELIGLWKLQTKNHKAIFTKNFTEKEYRELARIIEGKLGGAFIFRFCRDNATKNFRNYDDLKNTIIKEAEDRYMKEFETKTAESFKHQIYSLKKIKLRTTKTEKDLVDICIFLIVNIKYFEIITMLDDTQINNLQQNILKLKQQIENRNITTKKARNKIYEFYEFIYNYLDENYNKTLNNTPSIITSFNH